MISEGTKDPDLKLMICDINIMKKAKRHLKNMRTNRTYL